ncbi:MAG: hypothetical protein QOG62_1429, partial [Thermoleophilaceae bacterium]|nr:hypothetical protein [Thermoleophilaceae bacterium]
MTDPAGSANVEVVKRFYEAIETFLKSFDDDEALVTALSEEQQELRRSVTIEEAQALVAADALWEPLWSPSPFR